MVQSQLRRNVEGRAKMKDDKLFELLSELKDKYPNIYRNFKGHIIGLLLILLRK